MERLRTNQVHGIFAVIVGTILTCGCTGVTILSQRFLLAEDEFENTPLLRCDYPANAEEWEKTLVKDVMRLNETGKQFHFTNSRTQLRKTRYKTKTTPLQKDVIERMTKYLFEKESNQKIDRFFNLFNCIAITAKRSHINWTSGYTLPDDCRILKLGKNNEIDRAAFFVAAARYFFFMGVPTAFTNDTSQETHVAKFLEMATAVKFTDPKIACHGFIDLARAGFETFMNNDTNVTRHQILSRVKSIGVHTLLATTPKSDRLGLVLENSIFKEAESYKPILENLMRHRGIQDELREYLAFLLFLRPLHLLTLMCDATLHGNENHWNAFTEDVATFLKQISKAQDVVFETPEGILWVIEEMWNSDTNYVLASRFWKKISGDIPKLLKTVLTHILDNNTREEIPKSRRKLIAFLMQLALTFNGYSIAVTLKFNADWTLNFEKSIAEDLFGTSNKAWDYRMSYIGKVKEWLAENNNVVAEIAKIVKLKKRPGETEQIVELKNEQHLGHGEIKRIVELKNEQNLGHGEIEQIAISTKAVAPTNTIKSSMLSNFINALTGNV